MELVGSEELFSSFVDHKFQELDRVCDGKLSVKELEPAVVDISAALGLPTQGTSADSDHIYYEVLNEFTHGKQGQVSKTEFKEVLSDILLGMAASLKRDSIVILRTDGKDLREFISSPDFEPEMISILSQFDLPEGSLCDYITRSLQQLTVEQGMPPLADSWVMSNIVKPALQTIAGCAHEQPISQDTFIVKFKKVAGSVAQHLAEQPVFVAYSENTFDGSGIKGLLASNFEIDKSLEALLYKFGDFV